MSSIEAVAGRLTVFEIAPERNGWVAAIMSMWPVCEIARSPTATSNTGRCSCFRPGAPTIVLFSLMWASIWAISASLYPSLRSAIGTERLTIVMLPPPTSSLNLTSEKSGSIPVVSQSIRKLIVPVGASTVACALR